MEKGNLIVLGLVFSFLPIWRSAGGNEGLTLWEYYSAVHQGDFNGFPYPHIPYNEAVSRARSAYQEVYGI
jgi:hypothetical protein